MRNQQVRQILESHGFEAQGASADDLAQMIEDSYLSFGKVKLGYTALRNLVMCYLSIHDYGIKFPNLDSTDRAADEIAGYYTLEREKPEKPTDTVATPATVAQTT